MASSRQGRTHWSMMAGASLLATASRRRPQRLSSTGQALTYAQSYPQVWIALGDLFDRSIRAGATGATGKQTKPRTLTTRQSRSPNGNTVIPGVASAFVG